LIRVVLTSAIIALIATTGAVAQIGPAPPGDAIDIAQQAIQENFTINDCPYITAALRLGDGSILTACGNGERFRVFAVANKLVAMRCSAVEKLGVKGACGK
jgi:hypothetical protein